MYTWPHWVGTASLRFTLGLSERVTLSQNFLSFALGLASHAPSRLPILDVRRTTGEGQAKRYYIPLAPLVRDEPFWVTEALD